MEHPLNTGMTEGLAYLTADIPGVGGVIKQRPEDFLVDEQPLYEPSGQGEHLYVFVEKRGQATTDVIRRMAKMFNVRRSDIGYAGLKDKHAITRQHFSIRLPEPGSEAKGLEKFQYTPFKLLWHARHGNKLRRGHLKGNRFVIRLREVEPATVLRARKVLDLLAAHGAPNFIGEQRFGYRQNNHLIGRAVLHRQWREALDELLGRPKPCDPDPSREARLRYEQGDYVGALELWPRQLRQDRQALDALRQGKTLEQAFAAIDQQQREFYISAWQSAIFNSVLDQRLREGTFSRLLPGDLAFKHDNRAVFAVDDATAETENKPGGRIERLEISPSGPMWGPDMTTADGAVLERERQALREAGMDLPRLAEIDHVPIVGVRRPLRIPVIDPDISAGADEHGPYIRVAFELPRGAFATIVLREMTKLVDAEGE